MIRSCYFRTSWFFRFAMALPALIGMTMASAMQQKHGADTINGRILGDDGNPLVNARVQVSKAESSGPIRISRSTTTDDEGYFRVTNLPSGEYYISASAAGYLHDYALATERSGQDNRLIHPGASVTITLKKGGVITGRVVDAEERAVVAVQVCLEYARDQYDRPIAAAWVEKEELTDDRGVYRFFGLRPGSYLVRAGGRGQQARGASAFDSDAPTYHPAATRETATEVRVRAGDEATGIDIRYRGERGYAIRGVVTGATDFNHSPDLRLIRLPGGERAGFTYARAEDKSHRFDFEGLPDGDYELIAERRGSDEEDNGAASPPRRVTIKGADVSGIEMRLVALSSISGRVVLAEGTPQCQSAYRKQLSYVTPIAHREGATRPPEERGRPNEQGEFTLRKLEAGRHRLEARLYDEWYLRAITQPGPSPARRPIDVSREGIPLRPGERKTGLILTVAEGAALLAGRVIPANEGARLPTRLRAHLVPAEPASADNALRYAETAVRNDGGFGMRHLAPGRYWLLARAAPDEESSETPSRPVVWDAASRAKLWREARAAKVEIELQACQRISDYALRYMSRD